jgi:hypothetical protein
MNVILSQFKNNSTKKASPIRRLEILKNPKSKNKSEIESPKSEIKNP